MQIRWTGKGKLATTSGDTINTSTKFQDKILQSRHTVTLDALNFSKILAKLYIHDRCLPIFLKSVCKIKNTVNLYAENFSKTLAKAHL